MNWLRRIWRAHKLALLELELREARQDHCVSMMSRTAAVDWDVSRAAAVRVRRLQLQIEKLKKK